MLAESVAVTVTDFTPVEESERALTLRVAPVFVLLSKVISSPSTELLSHVRSPSGVPLTVIVTV